MMIQKLVERIIVFRHIQVYFINAFIQRRPLPLYSSITDLYIQNRMHLQARNKINTKLGCVQYYVFHKRQNAVT